MKVLKIGGSILTDKSQSAVARPEEIQRVAKEIAVSAEDMVLIHGAGSFGHIPAKRYGLPRRFSPEGLRETHRSVVKLNEMMVDALSKAGIAPMPVHPFSCTLLRNGRIDCFPADLIRDMVRKGLLPVLHGDVAMDVSQKAGIVSGDQLVAYIAKTLKADLVAVGTNVDGVIFDGKSIADLTRKELPSIENAIGGSIAVDVTGGMKGKLLELLDLAEDGISSVIFNALKEGQIVRALKGDIVGTRVRR